MTAQTRPVVFAAPDVPTAALVVFPRDDGRDAVWVVGAPQDAEGTRAFTPVMNPEGIDPVDFAAVTFRLPRPVRPAADLRPTPAQVLATPMGPNDADADTIRGYLKALLRELWTDGEGFSGKKPFGNSSWEFELYRALVVAGHVPGELDENGYLDEITAEAERTANTLIRDAIGALA